MDTNGASLANAFGGSNRFVEITVTNHAPVAPRQQILTTPFAFRAASAATVDDGAITLQKLATRQVGTNVGIGGLALSANTGTNTWESPTPTVPTLITNLQVTLITRGGPVMVFLTDGGPDSTGVGNSSLIEVERGTGNTEVGLFLEFLRDGQHLGTYFQTDSAGPATYTRIIPSVFRLVDFSAPAGTHVYTIRASYGPATVIRFTNVRLAAFEL